MGKWEKLGQNLDKFVGRKVGSRQQRRLNAGRKKIKVGKVEKVGKSRKHWT